MVAPGSPATRTPFIVDLDDLTDSAQLSLLDRYRAAYPNALIHLYAVPNRLGPVHALREAHPWARFCIHGWEHTPGESLSWDTAETIRLLNLALSMGYEPVFKPQGWLLDPEVELGCREAGVLLHHHETYTPTTPGLICYPGPPLPSKPRHINLHTHLVRTPAIHDWIGNHPGFNPDLSQLHGPLTFWRIEQAAVRVPWGPTGLEPIPPAEIRLQYRTNVAHTDGVVEKEQEMALAYAKEALALLSPPPASVLDVGCRTGYCLREFSRALGSGVRVAGVDIVPEFIRAAKHRGEAHFADAQALPFRDGEFDLVFCCQTLEHARDARQALAECLRVAKRACYLSVPVEPRRTFEDNPSHHFHGHSEQVWLDLLAAHSGWQVVARGEGEHREDGSWDLNLMLMRGVER